MRNRDASRRAGIVLLFLLLSALTNCSLPIARMTVSQKHNRLAVERGRVRQLATPSVITSKPANGYHLKTGQRKDVLVSSRTTSEDTCFVSHFKKYSVHCIFRNTVTPAC
jgi:RNase P protein component